MTQRPAMFVLLLLSVAYSLPSVAQTWAWDEYGRSHYNGSVTLTDDLGGVADYLTDPEGGGVVGEAVSTQPPVIVIRSTTATPAGGTIYWEDRWW